MLAPRYNRPQRLGVPGPNIKQPVQLISLVCGKRVSICAAAAAAAAATTNLASVSASMLQRDLRFTRHPAMK